MYHLSVTSMKRLKGVHPSIIIIVCRSIQICEIDFMVGRDGGRRTEQQQRKLISSGKSETMQSYHLPQDDGFSHAVDLWALVNGSVPWKSLDAFKKVRDAVYQACNELGYALPTWGGDWDRDGRSDDHDFIDAPHFQWEDPRGLE